MSGAPSASYSITVRLEIPAGAYVGNVSSSRPVKVGDDLVEATAKLVYTGRSRPPILAAVRSGSVQDRVLTGATLQALVVGFRYEMLASCRLPSSVRARSRHRSCRGTRLSPSICRCRLTSTFLRRRSYRHHATDAVQDALPTAGVGPPTSRERCVSMTKGSDLFVAALENEGVERIFGVPGEENLDTVESLRTSSIELVVTRHEQSAAFMAATYGRLTGQARCLHQHAGAGGAESGDWRCVRAPGCDADDSDHRSEGDQEQPAGPIPDCRHGGDHEAADQVLPADRQHGEHSLTGP